MRLVASVDDAAVERCLQRDFLLDVVGALGDLKSWLFTFLSKANAASANHYLACHEERDEARGNRGKLGRAPVLVIFVRTVGCAFAIHIVLVELQWRARIMIRQHRCALRG